MMHHVTSIPADRCVIYWSQVRDHLSPAIKASKGRWELEYVLAGLVTGQQTLWIIYQEDTVVGAITTEVVCYPEKKMLMIHFMGGKNMNEWYREMSDTMTRWAKDNECDGIECIARSGFWKWFSADGFTRSAVFYEKVVV